MLMNLMKKWTPQRIHPEQLWGGFQRIEGTRLLKNSKDFINL